MRYTVIIKNTAQKQIQKIPKIYFDKIKKAVLNLESNPRPKGCIKLSGSEDIYRIRVGICTGRPVFSAGLYMA